MLREGFKFEKKKKFVFSSRKQGNKYVQNILLTPINDRGVGWFTIIFPPIFMVLVWFYMHDTW
jgi:hypothetical protein